MDQGFHTQKAVWVVPTAVPVGRGGSCSLHPEHRLSPSEHAQKLGTGYIALRRMTRTFSQPPASILPEFTGIPEAIMIMYIPVTFFYLNSEHPAFLLCWLLFPLQNPTQLLALQKVPPSLRANFGHSPLVALPTSTLHNCSFVCPTHWAVGVFFEYKWIWTPYSFS